MKKKSVLLSLNSQWVKPIFFTQEKIYEVRKRAPLLQPPYDVYVYCTKKEPLVHYESMLYKGDLNGLIIGKFTCIKNWERIPPWKDKSEGTALTDRQLAQYSNGEHLIFMEIQQPIMFQRPKKLEEFHVKCAPQSWVYVEV